MKAVELWDTNAGVFLALRQVLAPGAAQFGSSTWEVASYVYPNGDEYFWLGGDGDNALNALADTGRRMSGQEFLAIAERTSQVIWGVFRGYHSGADAPWVTLQAVDSTFWRCETKDVQTRQALMGAFKDVRLKP
jgi:hypothetical protein